jgi:YbbR domain-containing protein
MDKLLQNNNVVKGFALLIAILLWLVVRMDSHGSQVRTVSAERQETISNVVVNPVYDETTYKVKSISPQEVTVELRWKDSSFRKPNFSQLRVEANLGNLTEGTHQVFLSTTGLKTNIEASISPSSVQVTLEKIQHKQLPVSIIPIGKPYDGYKAGQPIVKPSRVSVSVPESLLSQVTEVRGEVSVEGAKENVVKQVKLTMYDKDGRVVEGEISPAVVDVEVPITSPFKQMPLQFKLKGELAPGYAVEGMIQEPETVTVYAPQEILNKLEFYEGPELDLTGLKATQSKTLTIPLQEGVTKVMPEEVAVTLKIVPSLTKTVGGIPVALTGQSRDYTYALSASTSTVNLTLTGAASILSGLEAQDISATVDLSSLGPGIHQLPVVVNLPLYVKRQGADPLVQVEITAKAGSSLPPSGSAAPTPGSSEGTSVTPSGNGAAESEHPGAEATPVLVLPTSTPQPQPEDEPTASSSP